MGRWNNDDSNRKKEYIISVLENMLEERDLSEITVTDLCARCKISRQLFYYHFDNLESLFLWAVKTSTKEDKEKVSLVDGIFDVCGAFHLRKVLTKAFFSSSYRDTIIGMIRKDFQMESERYVRDNVGIPLSDDQRRLLITLILNGSLGLIVDWIDEGMTVPISELRSIITMLMDMFDRPGNLPDILS